MAECRSGKDLSVAVIIPTYNGEAYVHHALSSLCDQGTVLGEVLVVDDGSSDRTVEIVRSFAGVLPLTLELTDGRNGWVRNTNRALRRVSAPFITFLHQDDRWEPGRLAKFENLMSSVAGADVFVNSSSFIDSAGRKIGRLRPPLPEGRLLPGTLVFERLIVQNFLAMPSPIFRRRLIAGRLELENGPLDELLWYTADWQLWLSLTVGSRWIFCAEPLTQFRVHDSSLTATAAVDAQFRQQFRTVIEEFLPADSPGSARTRGLVELSMEVNLFLASIFGGGERQLALLLRKLLAVGPLGWGDYVRFSRIHERLLARLRGLRWRRSTEALPAEAHPSGR